VFLWLLSPFCGIPCFCAYYPPSVAFRVFRVLVASSPLYPHPPIHTKRRPRNKRSLLRGQEAVEVSHFGGRTQAAEGCFGAEGIEDFLGDGIHHVGSDEARRNGVHRHVAAAELAGPHLGQPDDGSLGGHVVALPEVALDAHHRRGVHDAPVARLLQVGIHRLGAVEDPRQVHVDDLLPLLGRRILERRVAGNPRIVDQDVDAAEVGEDSLRRRRSLRQIGGVDGVETHLVALRGQGSRERLPRLLVDVPDGDGRSFGQEFFCGGPANALGAAGNNGDSVG